MPHPLKPNLLPIEQHLLPDLPTIVGNVVLLKGQYLILQVPMCLLCLSSKLRKTLHTMVKRFPSIF
jgi:hypothetical protein